MTPQQVLSVMTLGSVRLTLASLSSPTVFSVAHAQSATGVWSGL